MSPSRWLMFCVAKLITLAAVSPCTSTMYCVHSSMVVSPSLSVRWQNLFMNAGSLNPLTW